MPDRPKLADRVIAMARWLPERDYAVLSLRYGLDGPAQDLAGIAKALGVTRERARQRVELSIRHLVRAVADEGCKRADIEDLIVAGRIRERQRKGSDSSDVVRLRAEVDRLARLISDEPDAEDWLVPWWLTLWGACTTLVEKAGFKSVMRHMGRVDAERVVAWREVGRLRAEVQQATRERYAAIRRQVHEREDGRWYVAAGVNREDEERDGPFAGRAEAVASVFAWVRWSIDPADLPIPEYRDPSEEATP